MPGGVQFSRNFFSLPATSSQAIDAEATLYTDNSNIAEEQAAKIYYTGALTGDNVNAELEEFKNNTALFARFKQQYIDALEKMKVYSREHDTAINADMVANNLDLLGRHILSGDHYSTMQSFMFSQFKVYIDRTCALLADKSIPVDRFCSHILNIAAEAEMCAAGLMGKVGDLVDSLYASRGTLDSKIEQAKLEIIKHYAVKFIRDNLYDSAVGNETHYISTLLNKSASQLGIQPSLDNINMNEVTDELVADFISLVKEQLTPEIVAEQLVDNLQSQARVQFGIESDQYVIIDDSKYINAQKLLQEQYGDHWQMGHLLDTEGEIGTYRLQQNPTLLILSMLEYLQQKDMLDSSTEPALLATRPEKVDNSSSNKQTEIKLFRLGSLFWVEQSVTKTYTIADNTEADRGEPAPKRFQLTRPSSVASRRPLTHPITHISIIIDCFCETPMHDKGMYVMQT